jgi:hypothetical protein
MEHLDVLKQFGVTSLEEARELAELTDRIVANLKAIDENNNDLEALLEQTGFLAADLKYIEESNVDDLDELVEQTGTIAANLKYIEDHPAE